MCPSLVEAESAFRPIKRDRLYDIFRGQSTSSIKSAACAAAGCPSQSHVRAGEAPSEVPARATSADCTVADAPPRSFLACDKIAALKGFRGSIGNSFRVEQRHAASSDLRSRLATAEAINRMDLTDRRSALPPGRSTARDLGTYVRTSASSSLTPMVGPIRTTAIESPCAMISRPVNSELAAIKAKDTAGNGSSPPNGSVFKVHASCDDAATPGYRAAAGECGCSRVCAANAKHTDSFIAARQSRPR